MVLFTCRCVMVSSHISNGGGEGSNNKKSSQGRKKKKLNAKSKAQMARTHCRVLQRRMDRMELTSLVFDRLGRCIKPRAERKKWSSWCGKVGRTRVDICIKTWRDVDEAQRKDIWKECKVRFSSIII